MRSALAGVRFDPTHFHEDRFLPLDGLLDVAARPASVARTWARYSLGGRRYPDASTNPAEIDVTQAVDAGVTWVPLATLDVFRQDCPRLRAHCLRVAREKKAAYREEPYWGRPVPGFGDASARVLVVGLAPAAHGAYPWHESATTGKPVIPTAADPTDLAPGVSSRPMAALRSSARELPRAVARWLTRSTHPVNLAVFRIAVFAVLSASGKAAAHPLIRAVLQRIVRDERRHGRFGWFFFDWALDLLSADDRRHLARAARDEIGKLHRTWDLTVKQSRTIQDARTLGWLRPDTYLALASKSLEKEVIEPLKARGLYEDAGASG